MWTRQLSSVNSPFTFRNRLSFFNDFEDHRCCSVVLHLFTLGRCSNNCKWISSVAFSLHFLKALTEGVSHTLWVYFPFYRTSSGQSSNNSSKRRIIDWAKSWKRYNRKHQHNESNPEGNECQCKRCITRAMNNPEKALNSVSQIDKISRIVFPAAFALLNGFYWFSYLKHSQRIDLNFESAWSSIRNKTFNFLGSALLSREKRKDYPTQSRNAFLIFADIERSK